MNTKRMIRLPKHKHNVEDSLKKASKLQAIRNFDGALKIFEECLQQTGNNKFIELNIGLCKFHKGNYAEAARLFHELHARFNEDMQIINFCGIAYMKAGRYEIAGEFLKRYASKNPNDYETWLNLTQIAGATQNNTIAIYYATQALSVNPLDTRAHSNLGCALLMLEKIDDAIISLETAIQLDPNNFSAISNIASAYEKKAEYSEALAYYEKSLEIANTLSQDTDELKNRMSLSLLGSGNLRLGWEYWDLGFNSLDSRSRSPKRKFSKPKWNGEDLSSKRIMIWREQGIGDEIRLFGLTKEIISLADKVIIECQPRLVKLFQRSFPECEVREAPEYKITNQAAYTEDYDLELPVGSLARYLRPTIENFSPIKPYLQVDQKKLTVFKDRLKAYQGKRLLGISWRSGFVTSERSKYLTPIQDWESIFKLKNTVFVNLQYGDCQEEIQNAETEFNVSIINWPDINLKEDIESAVALTSLMDCVVSAPTSVADIAMAVGTDLKFFTPRTWEFLGTDRYPWYEKTKAYIPSGEQSVSDMLPLIASDL